MQCDESGGCDGGSRKLTFWLAVGWMLLGAAMGGVGEAINISWLLFAGGAIQGFSGAIAIHQAIQAK
jgi:hypothetical protein